MKNPPEFLILGILLATFTTITNLGSAFGSGNEVHIEAGSGGQYSGKGFAPKEMFVPEGTTVKWVNDDTQGHTITSGTDVTDPDAGKLFNSGLPLLRPGAEWNHRFDKAGGFPYFCQVHPWMHGTVYVTSEESLKEEEASDAMLTDKSISAFVTIINMPLQPDKEMKIALRFVDPATNQLLQNVNYDLTIKDSRGNAVLDLKDSYSDSGTDLASIRFNSTGSYTLSINVKGIGIPPEPLDKSHSGFATIPLQVVPEFPALGLIVFASAVSLILVANLVVRTRPKISV